jgi:transcriptional regulator with XRE-family HTH domain
MQADYLLKTVSPESGEYNPGDMARRMTRPRSAYGKHLAELRKGAGLTQVELAGILGVPQSNIAFWEQSEKPPRSDVLPAMAQAFGVRLEELLKVETGRRTAAKKKNGPTGRVREVFDRVSKLPRRQQEKIVEFVSAFVSQYERSKEG